MVRVKRKSGGSSGNVGHACESLGAATLWQAAPQSRQRRGDFFWKVVASLMAIGAVLPTLATNGYAQAPPSFKGEVFNLDSKQIYHLQPDPNNPGVSPYTAWVGVWKLPNGTIQYDFMQGTGPKDKPVVTHPVFQSTDAGKTWTRVPGDIPTGYSRQMAVLPNGTMVRPAEVEIFGPHSNYSTGIAQRRDKTFGVERSTDGGKTWSQQVHLVKPADYQIVYPGVVYGTIDQAIVQQTFRLSPASSPKP